PLFRSPRQVVHRGAKLRLRLDSHRVNLHAGDLAGEVLNVKRHLLIAGQLGVVEVLQRHVHRDLVHVAIVNGRAAGLLFLRLARLRHRHRHRVTVPPREHTPRHHRHRPRQCDTPRQQRNPHIHDPLCGQNSHRFPLLSMSRRGGVPTAAQNPELRIDSAIFSGVLSPALPGTAPGRSVSVGRPEGGSSRPSAGVPSSPAGLSALPSSGFQSNSPPASANSSSTVSPCTRLTFAIDRPVLLATSASTALRSAACAFFSISASFASTRSMSDLLLSLSAFSLASSSRAAFASASARRARSRSACNARLPASPSASSPVAAGAAGVVVGSAPVAGVGSFSPIAARPIIA